MKSIDIRPICPIILYIFKLNDIYFMISESGEPIHCHMCLQGGLYSQKHYNTSTQCTMEIIYYLEYISGS